MMTITHTQSLPTLRLRLIPELRLAERLDSFLEQLQASPLFDQELIKEWRADFNHEFPSIAEGENEDLSLAFCMLLCSVIDPAMDETIKGSKNEAEIKAFEETLCSLLEKTVPRGESVDQFIATYETFIEQRELMYEQLEVIDSIVQEKMDQFCGSANAINGELQAKYQKLKERLRQINQLQMREMGKIHKEVEGEAASVNSLIEEFDRLACHLQRLDGRLEGVRVTLIEASEQCKQSLMRLKRG